MEYHHTPRITEALALNLHSPMQETVAADGTRVDPPPVGLPEAPIFKRRLLDTMQSAAGGVGSNLMDCYCMLPPEDQQEILQRHYLSQLQLLCPPPFSMYT